MAGLIKALFGGRSRPPDPDPLPGQGGYQLPRGPYGATGFPGSAPAAPKTRPQDTANAKLPSRKGVPLGGGEVRQESYRGDRPARSPRATPRVATARSSIPEELQRDPREFYGGPRLRTQPGLNDTAGGNTHQRGVPGGDVRDTETPPARRQPQIGVGTPGAANVRNTRATRYQARPEAVRPYQSAPRHDTGQVAEPVTVPSRFVFAGGGNQTWYVLREMPYGGRGDGARGAALNGQRYYATGQEDQFVNAGMGQYGIARERGAAHKRPVSFTEPAPWTAQYYDTAPGLADAGQGGAGSRVHVSAQSGRASNRTQRG